MFVFLKKRGLQKIILNVSDLLKQFKILSLLKSVGFPGPLGPSRPFGLPGPSGPPILPALVFLHGSQSFINEA